MKNIKNMIVVGGLCLSIACSAVFTLSPMTVYAINTIEYETEYMEPIEESDYLVNQNSRNIFTKIAKKAVKKAINNKARLVNFAEKVAGKTVAKNVNKFFTPITRALKPLLKWSEKGKLFTMLFLEQLLMQVVVGLLRLMWQMLLEKY